MYLVYETLWLHLGYSPFRRRLIISATSVCVNCRLDIGFICEPFKPFWNSAGKSLLGRWHRFKAFAIFAIKSFTIATASGCRIKSSRIRIQWSLFLTKLSGSMLLQPSLTTVSYCMYYLIHCVRKDKMPPMLAWGVRHRDLMTQGPPEWDVCNYVWYVWMDFRYDEVIQSALPLFWHGALAICRPAYSQQKSFVLLCMWHDSEGVELVSGLNSTLLHATEVYRPASIIASEYFRLQSRAVVVRVDN